MNLERENAASLFDLKFSATLPPTRFRRQAAYNLIGEHTDYNDGFVLPCAIDYQTVISCAPRDDRTVRVIAAD